MIREVNVNEKIIRYDLQRKKVKNINLRIKPDMTISVSANRLVSAEYIDEFIIRKSDFIFSALKRFSAYQKDDLVPQFSKNEFIHYVTDCFEKTYFKFSDKINRKPTLKFRTMKSRWGSCNYKEYIITINNNLIYLEKEYIEYVIIHEFAHLIVPNHSKDFYDVVSEYCGNYRFIDKELNKKHINRS